MTGFSGKRVLVTGVTSGIGRATATALVAAGADVVGIGRDEARLFALAETLGQRFTPLVVDLANRTAIERAVDTLHSGEDLDAIVNNAAECIYAAPLTTTRECWERLFDVNVFAPIQLVQGLAAKLAAAAHVVNVSSVNAEHVQNVKFAPYGASKAALAQITHALRMELGPRGIRVSQITPGLVDTELYQKVSGFERTEERLRAMIPTWLRAEDVARAIEWILSQPPHVTVGDLVLLPTGQS